MSKKRDLSVLLISGSVDDRISISKALVLAPSVRFTIEGAESLQAARERLGQGGIDVVLTSVSLPDSFGVDGLAQLRLASDKVPLIALSSHADQADGVQALRLGADDFLPRDGLNALLLERTLSFAVEFKQIASKGSASTGRLRELGKAALNALIVTDVGGQIIHANDSALRIYGYEQDELARQSILLLLAPRFRTRYARDFANFVANLASKPMGDQWKLSGWRKSGDEFPMEVNLVPVQTNDGPRVIFISRDLSDKGFLSRALGESEQKYRDLFDSLPVGIYRITPDGKILDFNPAFQKMLGYADRESLLKVNARELWANPADRDQMLHVMQTQDAAEFSEVRLRRQDGTPCWFSDSRHTVRDVDSSVSYYEGAINDINLLKRVQQDALDAWEFSQATSDALSSHLCVLDERGTILSVNKAWRDFADANPPGVPLHGIGLNYLQVCDAARGSGAEGAASFAAGLRAVMSGKTQQFVWEYPCHIPDGTQRWFMATVTPFVSAANLYIVITHIDVTERRLAEAARRKSENRFLLLFENMPNGIAHCKMIFENGRPKDFICLEVNSAFESLTGLSNVVGKKVSEVIPGFCESDAELFDIFGRVALGGLPEKFETYVAALDMWFSISVFSLEQETFVAQFDVITERKKLEIAMQENKERLQSTLDNLMEGCQVIGYDWKYVYVNDKVAEQGRKTREELLGHTMMEVYPGIDETPLFETLCKCMETRQPQRMVNRWDYPDDRTHWFELRIQPVPEGIFILSSDITEHYRAEEALRVMNAELENRVAERTAALRQVSERVSTILNTAPDAILLLNAGGSIDSGNPMFSTWFGYGPDDMHGHSPIELVTPAFVQSLHDIIEQTIQKKDVHRIDVVAQRKDGTTFDANVALAPMMQADHLLGIVCSIQDISEHKELQNMKDAFVSNVSHELRTPITSLKLTQDLMTRDPLRMSVYQERLRNDIDRLNDLIEDLLRLSRLDQRRTEFTSEPVNLNDIVETYAKDRSPMAESNSLTLTSTLLSEPALVEGDPGLLGQALSVLLTNALNYTPAGGTVRVEVLSAVREGRTWAGMQVRDTGVGISRDDLQHLGERFYRGKTGRDSGKSGTGLGLAIAHEIMSQHHGRLDIESEGIAGKGAAFTLWIPAAHFNAE